MPRLDANRLEAWRELQSVVADITRAIDEDLRLEWAVPLGWFDVLATLRRLDGRARPHDVAAVMRLPASSLSRRFDRLEEEGWIARHRQVDPDDHRAVEVELTPRGRTLWREMSVTYRRAVQERFASHLADDEVAHLVTVIEAIDPVSADRSDAEPD